MNSTLQIGTSEDKVRGQVPTCAARFTGRAVVFLLFGCLCVGLTGCFGFLKPAESTTRHFVLTPVLPSASQALPVDSVALGVAQVKIPAYLFDTSLAVRRGANEIEYLPNALWAERLDTGIQRVLSANLGTLLHTDQIRLTAWRSEDISAEVYAAIEQFEIDEKGQGTILARWRILSPGGEKILKTGQFRLTRPGISPDNDVSASVVALSDLLGEFSRELGKALNDLAPALKPAATAK